MRGTEPTYHRPDSKEKTLADALPSAELELAKKVMVTAENSEEEKQLMEQLLRSFSDANNLERNKFNAVMSALDSRPAMQNLIIRKITDHFNLKGRWEIEDFTQKNIRIEFAQPPIVNHKEDGWLIKYYVLEREQSKTKDGKIIWEPMDGDLSRVNYIAPLISQKQANGKARFLSPAGNAKTEMKKAA